VRRTKVLGYPAPEYEHDHHREPENARTAPQAATSSTTHPPLPLDKRSSIWATIQKRRADNASRLGRVDSREGVRLGGRDDRVPSWPGSRPAPAPASACSVANSIARRDVPPGMKAIVRTAQPDARDWGAGEVRDRWCRRVLASYCDVSARCNCVLATSGHGANGGPAKGPGVNLGSGAMIEPADGSILS
jgi:hypothetical protein